MFLVFLLFPILSWSISTPEIAETMKYVADVHTTVERQGLGAKMENEKKSEGSKILHMYADIVGLSVLHHFRSHIIYAGKIFKLLQDGKWPLPTRDTKTEFSIPSVSNFDFSKADEILEKIISTIVLTGSPDELSRATLDSVSQKSEGPMINFILSYRNKISPGDGSLPDDSLRQVLNFCDSEVVNKNVDTMQRLIAEADGSKVDVFEQDVQRIKAETEGLYPYFGKLGLYLFELLLKLKTTSIFRESLVQLKTVLVPPRPAGFEDTVALVEDLMNLPTMIENLRLQAGSGKILAEVDPDLKKILDDTTPEAEKIKILENLKSTIKSFETKKTPVKVPVVVPTTPTTVPTSTVPTGNVSPVAVVSPAKTNTSTSTKPVAVQLPLAVVAKVEDTENGGEVTGTLPAVGSDDDTDSGSPDENTKSKKKKKSGSSKWLVVGLCVGLGVPFLIAVAVVLVKKYRTAAEAAQSPV